MAGSRVAYVAVVALSAGWQGWAPPRMRIGAPDSLTTAAAPG